MAENDSCPSNCLKHDGSTTSSVLSAPTRIILRLSVQDFASDGHSWYDYRSAVQAYLSWANRSLTDWKEGRHNIFVEHFQDPELMQKRFHVVIDLYSLSFEVVDPDNIQHEIYDIKRNSEGNLDVRQAKNPDMARNMIRVVRQFTDRDYPWGKEGWDAASKK